MTYLQARHRTREKRNENHLRADGWRRIGNFYVRKLTARERGNLLYYYHHADAETHDQKMAIIREAIEGACIRRVAQ